MRFYDLSIAIIGTIIGICALTGIVSQFFLGKNNVIEEASEHIIEEETGISIDLSP